MCLSRSSASYWPQTKVISLVKSSLVLFLVSFLGLETKVVFSSPVQVRHRSQVLLDQCNFTPHQRLFTIIDFIECMNSKQNAKTTVKRKSRATDEIGNLFEIPEYYHLYSSMQSEDYPKPADPAENFRSFFNINIFNALSLISKYDDYKCIPRIVCEIATGVIPEISEYKQNYLNTPISSLISFLSSLNIGESSSPLLLFGKSALMGYSNKGNPEICYHQYPKCPRNSNDLVNYLNNYNGGFFRLFNNHNSNDYYQKEADYEAPEYLNLPEDSITDRKGTGELKFDISMPLSRSSSQVFVNERTSNNKIIFPESQRHGKAFITADQNKEYENNDRTMVEKPSFFPQDRKDQRITEIEYDLEQNEDLNKDPQIPGRQHIMIGIDNSQLFPKRFKNTLKQGLINDDVLQPIDLEGLNVINLVELYAEDETQLEQVFHPCDMICHDSRGTSVQFNQLLNYGSLSTFMTPERPILDLSQPLPCQILCHNEHGEKRGIFTTLSQVLRASLDRKESQEYSSTNESLRVKVIKPRFVGDSIMDERTMNLPVTLSDPNSVLLSEMSPMQLTGGQVPPNLQSWQQRTVLGGQQGMMRSMNGAFFPQVEAPVGDNPLAIITNAFHTAQTAYTSSYSQQSALPASFTMCGSYLYIVPLNTLATPICLTSPNTGTMTQTPMLSIGKNPYGNYTNFFARMASNYNSDDFDDPGDFLPVISHNQSTFSEFPQQVTPSNYADITMATNEPNVAVLNPGDYPQAPCPEGESWNSDDNQCVPIRSHEDTEDEYINPLEIQTSSEVRSAKRGGPQKVIIKIPSADMYIQSN